MPLRLWVFSGAMLLVVIGGYVALISIAPADLLATPEGVDTALPTAIPPGPEAVRVTARSGSGEAGERAGLPAPAGAVIGADGVARVEMPFEVAPGPAPDAALLAGIDAYARAVTATLPAVTGADTLEAVEIDGRMIVFNHRIDISLREYALPIDPRQEIIPDLDGWLCDGSTCFEFHQDFTDERCRSTLRPLLEGGAVAVFKYRDSEGLPIGTVVITAADCAV